MSLPGRTRVPALSTNHVATGLPVDAVLSAGLVGVGSLSTTIGPPGVEAAVVGALGAGGTGACSQYTEGALGKVGAGISNRGGQSTGGRNSGGDDSCERDHFECLVCKVGLETKGDVGLEVWLRERMTVVRNCWTATQSTLIQVVRVDLTPMA